MLQAWSEKHNAFLRPLKKKGFKEVKVTTIGWYDIGKSQDPGIQQEPHALRHAIAVHLLDAGADVAFVQDRLGHANIQNTISYMRYTTVTRDAKTRQLFARHRVV